MDRDILKANWKKCQNRRNEKGGPMGSLFHRLHPFLTRHPELKHVEELCSTLDSCA
jgi:hypothetical protein